MRNSYFASYLRSYSIMKTRRNLRFRFCDRYIFKSRIRFSQRMKFQRRKLHDTPFMSSRFPFSAICHPSSSNFCMFSLRCRVIFQYNEFFFSQISSFVGFDNVFFSHFHLIQAYIENRVTKHTC